MNCIEVKDCTMIIRSNDGVMWFGINEERAGLIMSALKDAKSIGGRANTYHERLKAQELLKSGSIEKRCEGLEILGYKRVGDFDTMILYVKCLYTGQGTYSFAYVSKKWPNKNGSTFITIYLDI